jgi:hypothetical protein
MSNTTEHTLPLTEADINQPKPDAPAPDNAPAKAKAKTKAALALTEAMLAAAIEAEIAAEDDIPPPPASMDYGAMARAILAKTSEGPTVARAAARAVGRTLNHPADFFQLSRELESSKRGDNEGRLAAIRQLNEMGRRMSELSDEPTKKLLIGDHGVYAGLTPGTYGAEIGVVSKRKDGNHAHTGIGFYLRCEHLQPYDGPAADVTGI